MQFKLNLSGGLSLIFNIIEADFAKQWASYIQKRNIDECCKINHYVGYATEEMIQKKISRLYELADYINTFSPSRVIKEEINRQTWKIALHNMHVHFPDMKNDEQYKEVWSSLTEYNDIIHWLESVLLNLWSDNGLSETSLLRITLDFNKTVFDFYTLPDEAYQYFTPFFEFGDLCLHYTHVGKHAYEMFSVNDYECPADQFVPQRTFNAGTRMPFYDNFYPTVEAREKVSERWKNFYDAKGGIDYWGYAIDDPKIAFGFCKIGHLSSILDNDITIPIPKTKDELNQFRDRMIKTNVIDWEIKGA
jgi:hypothetical protein